MTLCRTIACWLNCGKWGGKAHRLADAPRHAHDFGYQATINTGRAPATTTIEKPWAMRYIEGLILPPMVETVERARESGSPVFVQF